MVISWSSCPAGGPPTPMHGTTKSEPRSIAVRSTSATTLTRAAACRASIIRCARPRATSRAWGSTSTSLICQLPRSSAEMRSASSPRVNTALPAPISVSTLSSSATAAPHRVAKGADAVDSHLDHVARTEKALGIAERSGARRRAGQDQIAGLQAGAGADVPEDRRDVEHHRADHVVLQGLVADRRPDPAGRRIADLVGGDQPRAERGEGVEGLRPGPLLLGELNVASRDVVGDRVGGDSVEPGRPVRRAVAPDQDRELSLVVDLGRDLVGD